MADQITQTNQQILGYFQNQNYLNLIGWAIFFIIVIIAGFGIYIYYKNKRIYNKKIVAHETVGEYYFPSIRDIAKTDKIGSGGFEVLYLKRLKVWKLAWGGKVGRNEYSFYIMPDNYWYSGLQSANLKYMDKEKGLIPVIATSQSMRVQYTAMEKELRDLHQKKPSFMDKWGTWIFSIGFVVIAGFFLWLNYQQFVKASALLSSAIDKLVSTCQGGSNVNIK